VTNKKEVEITTMKGSIAFVEHNETLIKIEERFTPEGLIKPRPIVIIRKEDMLPYLKDLVNLCQ
jgi:hypothetical protein